jgi:hypothetical protein
MVSRQRRTHVVLVLVVVLVLIAAVAAACSAQASGTSSDSAGDAPAAPASSPTDGSQTGAGAGTAKSGANEDWDRIALALAWMRDTTPTEPVVVLLGGSAARESTIDDGSWRDQIEAKGGPRTLAWNMGSRNRTMAQNLAIVKKLPKVPTIIYVGINLGSFTSTQKSASITLPVPAPGAGDITLEQPHSYTRSKILSTAKKKALVRQWIADRYPVYKKNFSKNAALLADLIEYCAGVKDEDGKRLFRPVLFELPRNTQVIGGSLNAPSKKYREKCAALHAKYGVPWVSLVSSAKIPNSSFYDLWHLVEPGRKIWQDKLSGKTVSLLKAYGFDGGGS